MSRPRAGSVRAKAAGLAPLVLLLAACSGAAGDTAAPSAAAGAGSDGSGAAGAVGGSGGAMPGGAGFGGGGVQGGVAAVAGTSMQVQDADSQTAVTWSDTTSFRRTVPTAASAATVGTCVVVVGGTDAAATSVAVSDPVDGECTAGFGRAGSGGGGVPTDLPGGMPTDLPSGMPSGMPTERPDGATGATTGVDATVGLVTAAADGSLTVETTEADGASTTATLSVDAATSWTRTSASDASAVAVGLCASAQGETDDSGGMTATSVTLSDPTDGTCSTRMMARADG